MPPQIIWMLRVTDVDDDDSLYFYKSKESAQKAANSLVGYELTWKKTVGELGSLIFYARHEDIDEESFPTADLYISPEHVQD